MKLFTLFFFVLSTSSLFAELDVNVYYEQSTDGIQILADNSELFPVSIEIKFDLSNLRSTNGNNKIFVVPARTKKHLITDLKTINIRRGIKFNFSSQMNYGDATQTEYDEDFEYYLPFKKGESFTIWQGYNGSFSHQGENALDFNMSEGTEIYAARGGLVVKVVEKNTRSCSRSDCVKYNNYILIQHSDGTFGEYTHIKKGGSVVKVGEEVEIGQFLGYSGDVGYATGPHLHFVVFLQKIENRRTVRTKFKTGKGDKTETLFEKKTYMRDY